MVIPGECFGNIETAHAPELLFLFEKEELMGLHQELPANFIIIINYNIIDTLPDQFFPAGETGRSGTNDGNGGFMHIYSPVSPALFY